jgi:predicted transcriptional regulator
LALRRLALAFLLAQPLPPRRTLGGAPPHLTLSRRERQIMDVVYRAGRATAAEVHALLPDPPSPTAVRTWIRILEEKGHLRHEKDGPRHVYLPTASWDTVQRSALRHLLGALFDGSPAAVVATLLKVSDTPLSDAERAELRGLIDDARREGR